MSPLYQPTVDHLSEHPTTTSAATRASMRIKGLIDLSLYSDALPDSCPPPTVCRFIGESLFLPKLDWNRCSYRGESNLQTREDNKSSLIGRLRLYAGQNEDATPAHETLAHELCYAAVRSETALIAQNERASRL